jgi:hypothetical protein
MKSLPDSEDNSRSPYDHTDEGDVSPGFFGNLARAWECVQEICRQSRTQNPIQALACSITLASRSESTNHNQNYNWVRLARGASGSVLRTKGSIHKPKACWVRFVAGVFAAQGFASWPRERGARPGRPRASGRSGQRSARQSSCCATSAMAACGPRKDSAASTRPGTSARGLGSRRSQFQRQGLNACRKASNSSGSRKSK